MTMSGPHYASRTISRTRPTVSSIMSAVTSRCVLAQARHHVVAADTGAIRLEEDQVGFGLLYFHALDLREAARECPGIGVIVGKPVDVVVERVNAGGGADAGL